VPSITSLIVLAALVSVPALILVTWVGLLFHRVLRLPADEQKHGVTVLKQLTALARVSVEVRGTNGRRTRRRLRRAGSPRTESRP
jgi:hypothetical protein